MNGPHQLLPGRGARLRLCAVLRAGVGSHTVAQICTCHRAGAVASLKGDAAIAGLGGHAGGHGHRAVHHQRGRRVFAVRHVPEAADSQPFPLTGGSDGKAVHAPVFGVAKAHQLLIARHFDDAIGCERYA